MIVFTVDLMDLIMYGLGAILLIGIGLYILVRKLIEKIKYRWYNDKNYNLW